VAHLDHLTLFVGDHHATARWYTENLGFEVEFETPDGLTTAIRDDRDFTIFLTNRTPSEEEPRCILYFEVPDVDVEYQRLIEKGATSIHAPSTSPWGYGPELADPDGHRIRIWDTRSVT